MNLTLFDIDGTLVGPEIESGSANDACFILALSLTHGLREIDSNWSRYPHMTSSYIIGELLREHFGRMAMAEEIGAVRGEYLLQLEHAIARGEPVARPMGGAAAMMTSLRLQAGRNAALATGGWREAALLKLRHAGIDVMGLPGGFAEDHTTRDGIAIAARKHAEGAAGQTAERVVYVGDATWDVNTCIVLQLPFVGVGRGERAERLRLAGASTIIEQFGDDFSRILDLATVPTPIR